MPQLPANQAKGRALEERIADLFAAHGYRVRRNAVVEGRSGARHEIDVLAERSDALADTRLMVECKAWGRPIEKDVVAKAHLVMQDAGMNHAVIVALDGWRAGADTAAAERGIDLWGPREIRDRLGDLALGALRDGETHHLAEGLAPVVTAEAAHRWFARRSRAALGLVREEIVGPGLLWHPHHLLQVACSREEGRFRARTVTRRTWNLYDAVTGDLTATATDEPVREAVDVGDAALPVRVPSRRIEKDIAQALGRLDEVTTEAAWDRHAARLDALGIALPVVGVVVERSSLHHLPVWVAVLHRRGAHRVLALDAVTGRAMEDASRRLTAEASLVTEALERASEGLPHGVR